MRNFYPFVFTGLTGLPCPCSPPRLGGLTDTLGATSTSIPTPTVSSALTNSILSTIQPAASGTGSTEEEKLVKSDRDVLFTASVAELRRKAQEHSAALWQSLQQIQDANSSSPAVPEITLPTVPEPAKNVEKMLKEDTAATTLL